MSLHDDEFTIDDELVHDLVCSQAPQCAELALGRRETSGTVNVIHRLGDRAFGLVDGDRSIRTSMNRLRADTNPVFVGQARRALTGTVG